MIIRYPSLYTVNPLELKDVIDFINNKDLNLKDFINNKPEVLSFDLYEIKKFMEK